MLNKWDWMSHGVNLKAIVEETKNVCGVSKIGAIKRATAWWNDQVKDAVNMKREKWMLLLQAVQGSNDWRNRKNEYNESKQRTKRIISESKRRVNEDLGRKIN